MKKLLSLITVLILSIVLVSCNGEISVGEYPELNEKDIVDMSTDDVAKMLSTAATIETEEENIFALTASANIDYAISEAFGTVSYDTSLMADVSFEGYMEPNENLDMSALSLEANIDISYVQSIVMEGMTSETEMSFEGAAGVYLHDSYTYLNLNITTQTSGLEQTIDLKQKMDMSDATSDIADMFDLTELEDILTSEEMTFSEEDVKAFLEAYPMFHVYEVSNTYFLEFSIDKASLKTYYSELYKLYYEMENGSEPLNTDVIYAANEFSYQLDEMFTTLELSLVIAVVDGSFGQFAIEGNVVLNDDYGSSLGFSFILDKVSEMKALPDDLDSYTEVEDFESIFDNILS